MIASANGHHECVDFLLKVGAEKNTQDKWDSTALMEASVNGHHACLDLLLKAGAERNTQDNEGWTALSLASLTSRMNCIKLLQQADAASADAAMSSLLHDLEEEKGQA